METDSQLITQGNSFSGIRNWWLDLLFCAALAGLAIVIGLRSTASGPGISPDSVTYISVAENLAHGKGFVSNLAGAFSPDAHTPLTSWPPGYPLMIAGLIMIGLPAIAAAKLVTILSFALLLVVVYWLAHRLSGRQVALLSSLAILVWMPVLRAATFALSEMPFALFSTLAVAAFLQYTRAVPARKWTWLAAGALSTAVAILTRYIGLVWIPAGVFVISLVALADGRQSIAGTLRRAVFPALVYVLIAVLPILPWFIRNSILTGQATGVDRLGGYHPSLPENFRYALGTLVRELIPSIHIGLRSLLSQNRLLVIFAALVILLLAGGLVALAVKGARREKAGRHGRRAVFSNSRDFLAWLVPVLFSVVYLVSAILLASVQLFPNYDWPRILVVIYPLVMVILLVSWARLIHVALRDTPALIGEIAAAVPALLLIIPYAVQTAGFIPQAAQGQELSTRDWRESQGIQFLMETALPEDTIISDQPYGVGYILDRPVRYLPYRTEYDRFSALVASPEPGGFYMIVFKGALGQPDPYFAPRLSAGDIARLAGSHANVRRMADFVDSTIYLVR